MLRISACSSARPPRGARAPASPRAAPRPRPGATRPAGRSRSERTSRRRSRRARGHATTRAPSPAPRQLAPDVRPRAPCRHRQRAGRSAGRRAAPDQASARSCAPRVTMSPFEWLSGPCASALRSCEMCTCTVFAAVAGGRSPTTRRSAGRCSAARCANEKQGRQRALLASPGRDHPALVESLQGAKYVKVHASRLDGTRSAHRTLPGSAPQGASLLLLPHFCRP